MKMLLILLMLLAAMPLHAQSSASYRLLFDVFDSGGSGPFLSTSAAHRAHSIVGQAAQLHTSRSASFVVSSGAECLFCELLVSTAVNPSILPRVMRLYQNYPNPFNPTTVIRYVLERPSTVEIAVYSMLGEKLRVLFQGVKEPGDYRIDFDAVSLGSGVYIYRLSTEHGALSRRMVLAR
jgi:hypothetical protein